MENNKLEIAGRELVVSPPSSYKKLPANDIEQGLDEMIPKASNQTDDCMDDPDEKVIPEEDSKLIHEKKDAEVKFLADEKQNGDTKVDTGDIKVGFVGMGKEELMKYANDPFWVRLRWILFILFWLVWVLMLAGAIAIIIAAPKCAPPEPRKWWQEGPLAEIKPEAVSANLIHQLKDQGIKGVIVSGGSDVYERQDVSILKDLMTNDMNAIIGLRPGSSERWFNESEHRVSPYDDYYQWADPSGGTNTDARNPPNNWLSPVGGSAWKYSETRKQFYLAQMGEPDLNFWKREVVDEFSNVMQTWLDAGARGISLSGLDMLFVDPEYKNEDVGSQGANVMHDDYRFYTHKYTRNQPNIKDALVVWRNVLKNITNNEGVLLLMEDVELLEPYTMDDQLLVDLPRYSAVFNLSHRVPTAEQIYNGLLSTKSALGNNTWPAWQYTSGGLPNDVLDIITMLLEGTPIVAINNSSRWSIDPALLQARQSPSVMFGSFESFLLNNKTVFAYVREKSGNPGYMVICNPSSTNMTVDFTQAKNVSESLTVLAASQAYSSETIKPKANVLSNAVPAPAKSAIVLTYVPKTD